LKDIRQKLLATFQIEHRDHVEQIRSLLALIEKTAQPTGPELEEAFRRAHSLKGAARAVDLRPVEGLAHKMETLFSRVRQGALLLDENVAGVLQQVLDASEDCVAALGEETPGSSYASALQAIERVLGTEAEKPDSRPLELPTPIPSFHPAEMVRITAQNFDGMLRSAGGLLTESQQQEQVTVQLNAIVRQMARLEKEGERARQMAASLHLGEAQHETSRLNTALDSLAKQVRSVSRQAAGVRRLQQRCSWSMRQLGKQLQRDVWQARMVPAESLLEGYRKMVRDLARDESKEIEFRATGAGVDADRRVLEALKDPLMHALRNAVSHGIESPPERAAKGKPRVGLITLRVDTNGQRLTVEIQDDGRGIDFARVVEIAVRQGILSESRAASSSPHELAHILFRPGFSTSLSVTNLSGRGMGMSVMYEAVRRLQGDMDLRPVEGGGTLIHLSVPLSIATHRLLLTKCCSQLLAIPIHAIERLLRIQLTSIETLEGKPVIVLDREAVPLLSMRQLLGLEQELVRDESGALPVMVLRSGSRRAAITVDSFLWEREAVIQDLGPAGRTGKVSSGVVLEDGAIAFVLNPMQLMENSVQPEPSHFTKLAEPKRSEQAPVSVLVVDDSMTTRMLEKSILEAHGYRVRIAVDGMEALELLRTEKSDLVIADIEMPRLDGFGLIEAMKKDRNLERIPVIVVSSVERREDQERGLALGADAYIVKRKFDQEELLTAIRQII
jgi:two-component system, chemotaxis family, sensor kinase CheA